MFSRIWKFMKFWESKEEPDTAYPPNFLKVIVNPVARSKGIYDSQNKSILWYKDGKLFKTCPYSEEQLEAIKSTYNIPVVHEEFEEDEEFEFDVVAEFGVTRLKR